MKKSLRLLTVLALAAALAAACGNSGGSTSSGGGTPSATEVTVTLSPSRTTTDQPDILVTVRVKTGAEPAPDGTSVHMAVSSGGLAEPGADPPTDDSPLSSSITRETEDGAASAWWRAPATEGTYLLSASALGVTSTAELRVDQ